MYLPGTECLTAPVHSDIPGTAMTDWVIGIDPGLDGAIALVGPNFSRVWDTPVTAVQVGKGTKRVLLEGNAASLLRTARMIGCEAIVAIERIQAMPSFGPEGERTVKMGAASAFNMGLGWGLWRGICTGLGIPYTVVSPVSWKKHFVIAGKQQGGDSRVVAQQLFPSLGPELQRKKDHGRADALLIAHYLRTAERKG